MSIVTKAILKGYFETGDRPTEAQFIDLIDSVAILGTNTGDITFIGTVTATTGSFGYLNLSGGADFDSINVGGGYGNTGLTVTNTGQLSTDDYVLTETYVSASTFLSTPKIKSPSTDFIIIQNAITIQGSITASGDISASGTVYASNFESPGQEDININDNLDITGGITASGHISTSADVIGVTGSFLHLKGDGSEITNISIERVVHGNKVTTTESISVPSNFNNTVATNNTGEFTIAAGSDYTVGMDAQVDLQYTPIAERLYRYDVDTGNFIPYAQANIDSETTLIKGFGAGTAGVGNDITVRHNATVPENFVTTLYTTAHNVTQSEDPNNNPIVNDPNSITIQDQSTYTIKAGADVTIDGVHHGVVRKDIALFKTMGIGDTQAIGPSGSDSFNDQYNNIYPSASAHLHISASNPVVKIEAASGTGLLSIDGNISASSALTASNLLVDGSTIDFTGLPTSDPGVAGRLWNDSGDLKISS
tara:strand:- start:938 stop:2377 length:1440 start_codon:yes stop_codon:yes gene_type:complete